MIFYYSNIVCSLVAIIPLCENMPSGTAIKPGDVVTAMNGKTIEVEANIVIYIHIVQRDNVE